MQRKSSTELISDFKEALAAANQGRSLALVLIGSVARGTALTESDLDLLVVSDSPLRRVSTKGLVHAQYFTESEFVDRLRQGDDFAAWCTRFGVPIADGTVWSRITGSKEARAWPDWRAKLPHAARRLHLSVSMMALGDVDAAAEEASYALTHTGRAILLKAGEFPLSRPEMIKQLSTAGYPALSKLLQEFLFGAPNVAQIRKAIAYVRKLLIHLDRGWYATHHAERRRQSALKAQNRTKRSSAASATS